MRLACYCEGRDVLLTSGYEQVSMRMFRKRGMRQANGPESGDAGPLRIRNHALACRPWEVRLVSEPPLPPAVAPLGECATA